MTATTITTISYKRINCAKCAGEGRIAYFSHNKGGECFACSGSGGYDETVSTQREMEDYEVIEALAAKGFPVLDLQALATDDFSFLFEPTPEEKAQNAQIMIGARMMLNALSA